MKFNKQLAVLIVNTTLLSVVGVLAVISLNTKSEKVKALAELKQENEMLRCINTGMIAGMDYNYAEKICIENNKK